MEIVYAAHTRSGVFMLDENGVCRWAVEQPGRAEKVPERIVGAQYLATLDVNVEGAIVDFPRVGCPMLFAATDETGRVRLVRTPPLLRFEDRRVAPMRRPLASKFDFDDLAPAPAPARFNADEEKTPVALAHTSSFPPPPPPSATEPSIPLPLTTPITQRTPLPPPPRARIAARIPPPPHLPSAPSLSSTGSGLRVTPPSSPGVQSIPVRFHAANMSLRKLARGK
jgi:hypothetical protein